MQESFIPGTTTSNSAEYTFEWAAPSNIALVKYWGKKANQMPANPSLSLTLNNCRTTTSVTFTPTPTSSAATFDLLFEGAQKDSFRPKIQQFLERIDLFVPYLRHYHLRINTSNSFPHSSGIASSASGMAALALNILSLERALTPDMSDDYFYQKASFLARLGSGSACRSIRGKAVIWGIHSDFRESSDLYGTAFPAKLHEVFDNFRDAILLVDKGEKTVSSTVGHDLMNGHPYAAARFDQAHDNLSKLKTALETGDLQTFIHITESEALTLHAMMMASSPYYLLMKPNTLAIINEIWSFRNNTEIPVCFTLDAGANVHMLYPAKYAESVLQFIKDKLVGYCQNAQYICDEIGTGATQMR
jgi:diphosphomevalonate decarboxylase